MKKVIFILIIVIAIALISACSESTSYENEDAPRIHFTDSSVRSTLYTEVDSRIRIFYVDFFEKYKDTLNAMFDYEWTLLSIEEIYIPIEIVGMRYWTRSAPLPDGYIKAPEQFTEWTIEYHDGNGEIRHFVLNNHRNFSNQIIQYVTSHISEYYAEKFLENCETGVLVNSVHGIVLRSDFADSQRDYALREYIRLLATPEGAINLSSLTPANVFELVPLYLSFQLNLGYYTGYCRQLYEEIYEEIISEHLERVDSIMEAMNYFANNHLNAKVSVISHIENEGVRHHGGWRYIQGDRIDAEIYPQALFESYRGVLWE